MKPEILSNGWNVDVCVWHFGMCVMKTAHQDSTESVECPSTHFTLSESMYILKIWNQWAHTMSRLNFCWFQTNFSNWCAGLVSMQKHKRHLYLGGEFMKEYDQESLAIANAWLDPQVWIFFGTILLSILCLFAMLWLNCNPLVAMKVLIVECTMHVEYCPQYFFLAGSYVWLSPLQ